MDEMVVRVEARGDLPAEAYRAEALALGQILKSMVGISAEIRVEASGSLQRSNGKAVRVIDRR
jgi:phenylacetate-CoA ligase